MFMVNNIGRNIRVNTNSFYIVTGAMDRWLNQMTSNLKLQVVAGKSLMKEVLFDKQRICGDVTHWQCERKGVCKARLHTQGMLIVKRTNKHVHGSDIVAVLVSKLNRN